MKNISYQMLERWKQAAPLGRYKGDMGDSYILLMLSTYALYNPHTIIYIAIHSTP
jgi:hypothetical protein